MHNKKNKKLAYIPFFTDILFCTIFLKNNIQSGIELLRKISGGGTGPQQEQKMYGHIARFGRFTIDQVLQNKKKIKNLDKPVYRRRNSYKWSTWLEKLFCFINSLLPVLSWKSWSVHVSANWKCSVSKNLEPFESISHLHQYQKWYDYYKLSIVEYRAKNILNNASSN